MRHTFDLPRVKAVEKILSQTGGNGKKKENIVKKITNIKCSMVFSFVIYSNEVHRRIDAGTVTGEGGFLRW
jgi:hypothetical protein